MADSLAKAEAAEEIIAMSDEDRGNGEAGVDMPEPCPWCSGEQVQIFHAVACSRIKAIEYHANGKVRRVELGPMPQHLLDMEKA